MVRPFVSGVVFELANTVTYPFIGEMWKYVIFSFVNADQSIKSFNL